VILANQESNLQAINLHFDASEAAKYGYSFQILLREKPLARNLIEYASKKGLFSAKE
jgi:hypothetical protein